jgi:hypothetical protein
MMWLAYATVWLSTAAAVIYAISVTGRISPLWALLIPTFVTLASNKGGGNNNKEDDKSGTQHIDINQ